MLPLVGVMAGHAPLVLLLDDLQWADPATITALRYLQRRGGALPAAVVAAVRTEDAPPGHLARRLKPDTTVRLNPLTPAELAPLAVPDLHESTGGMPLASAGDRGAGDGRDRRRGGQVLGDDRPDSTTGIHDRGDKRRDPIGLDPRHRHPLAVDGKVAEPTESL